MLARRIIPCLDVKDGKVVKGVKFENLKDVGDPVEIAKYYTSAGADELVFLDITASHEPGHCCRCCREDCAGSFIPLTVSEKA